MNMKKKLFLKKLNKAQGALYYDMILFDCRYPVLFTCVSDSGDFFLAICHKADAQSREWIIGRTTENSVIYLLKDKITIREAILGNNTTLYQASLQTGHPSPLVNCVPVTSIPNNILPTAGCYMEADEHEFDTEIELLEHRRCMRVIRQLRQDTEVAKSTKIERIEQRYTTSSKPKTLIAMASKGGIYERKFISVQQSNTVKTQFYC